MNYEKNANSNEKYSDYKKGQGVVVRDYRGEGLRRIVWETIDGFVFVCSEEVFQSMENGSTKEFPVGFPERDVIACY